MPDRVKVIIQGLERAKAVIELWVPMFEQYNTPSAIDDAIVLLKEFEDGRKIVEDYLKSLGITKMPII